MSVEPHLRRLFADLIRSRWGLSFPDSRGDRLDAAITLTSHRTGRSPGSNLSALRNRDPEVERALVEALVVRESYFFRHDDQLRLFRRLVRAGQRGKQIRVWSAGCSTGEEPYSLAMAALEELGPSASDRVEILATDLSEHALRMAQRGWYRPWSFRETDEATARRWFEPHQDGYRLQAAPRALVRWQRLNLCEPRSAAWPAACDVIFVRNVCMYLDEGSIRLVGANLAESLKPEGLLLTGPSDPELSRICPELRFDAAAALYRRADCDGPQESGLRSRSALRSETLHAVRPEHVLARKLIDDGDTSAAMRALDRLVDKDPADGSALALRAYVWMLRSDARAALTDAVCATDLAPGFAFAHWTAAQALAELGRGPAALRRLDRLEELIATYPAEQPIALGGSLTVGTLRESSERLARQLQNQTSVSC